MQNPLPPLVLSFGASDPTGASGIQGDLAVVGSFGCHSLSVVTRLLVRDSVGIEGAMTVDAEWVVDQARCLLEDMQVQAFKVGDVGSAENVAAIAEIVADYPDAALILAPPHRDDSTGLVDEETRIAIAELLVPQTSVLVARRSALGWFVADDTDERGEAADDPVLHTETTLLHLLEAGCEYVLAADWDAQSLQVNHQLFGAGEAGQPLMLRRVTRDRLALQYFGSTDALSAAIAGLVGGGMDVPDAIGEAHEYVHQALLAGFRLGMGKLIPDRLFWAREDDGPQTQGGNDTPKPDSIH